MIASPVIPNKERTVCKSHKQLFHLIQLGGAHQCGILMDVLGGLAAFISTTTSASTCALSEGQLRDRESTAYRLALG